MFSYRLQIASSDKNMKTTNSILFDLIVYYFTKNFKIKSWEKGNNFMRWFA